MYDISTNKRVVILGGSGFIGQSICKKLGHLYDMVSISSDTIDLSHPQSVDILRDLLRPNDSVILLAAISPDKGRQSSFFTSNIQIAQNVANAICHIQCHQLLCFSSEAVYSFNHADEINETTPTQPDSLYGMMHLAREAIITDILKVDKTSISILRPSQIYGELDTHKAYGPSKMLHTIQNKKKIEVFGRGEENRDHISIKDIVKTVEILLKNPRPSILNLAAGQSHTFLNIALMLQNTFKKNRQLDIPIEFLPRKQPITHRHHDSSTLKSIFKENDHKHETLEVYLDEISRESSLVGTD